MFDKNKFNKIEKGDDEKVEDKSDRISYILIALAALFVLGTLIRFLFF